MLHGLQLLESSHLGYETIAEKQAAANQTERHLSLFQNHDIRTAIQQWYSSDLFQLSKQLMTPSTWERRYSQHLQNIMSVLKTFCVSKQDFLLPKIRKSLDLIGLLR